MKKEALNILHHFAKDNRQIISLWRAKLYYQKENPFIQDNKVLNNLEELEKIGALEKVPFSSKLWRATTPYLDLTNNVYELVGEAYPTSVFCYSTALEILRITDQRFNLLHIYKPNLSDNNFNQLNSSLSNILIPADTNKNEWQINDIPKNTSLKSIWQAHEISTHTIKDEWLFGVQIREIQGINVKTTDLERTLIDGLKNPKYCGGLNEVFKAWVRSIDDFDIDKIVHYVEMIDSSIIYQRVGFVLEKIGLTHSSFRKWKENKSPRGGSRLLNPSKEFSSNYDTDWNISINHPISILSNKDANYS